MTSPSSTVRSRGYRFSPTLSTKITREVASQDNPYLVQEVRIHGYDHLQLMQQCQVSDVIFLLLRGELPQPQEADLFRELFIGLINPGLRHPATQASITAGVGKTVSTHILPIALSLYGGEFEGCSGIEDAMRCYHRYSQQPLTSQLPELTALAQTGQLAGFGTVFGSPDSYTARLLDSLAERYDLPLLVWIKQLQASLVEHGIGILRSGLFAAVAVELGFQPRQGSALMQLLAAPGLLAHGLEYSNKPLTSMLFEPDDHYHIDADQFSAPAPSSPTLATTEEAGQ